MAREKWLISETELKDEQHDVRELNPKKSFTIQGCAGSGKTILALWKAKFHQDSGDSFYLIVYTKALKKFIEDGVADIGLSTNRVLTYNSWQAQGYPGADYLIVDEAQDFCKSEILRMKEKANVSVMFFGDSVQQLYDKSRDTGEPTLTMPDIAEFADAPLRALSKNYRLPKSIAKFAQRIPKKFDDLESRCVRPGISIPIVTKFKDRTAELNFIVEKIRLEGLTDVGIVVPTNDDALYVHNYLQSKKLRCELKHDHTMTLDFVTNNPKIITYHSSKGLQFETVFVPFCEVSEEFYRNSLYVAVTRPYKDLYISFSNKLSSFINSMPKSLYTFIS